MSSTITRTENRTGLGGNEVPDSAAKPPKVPIGMDVSPAGPKPNPIAIMVIVFGLIAAYGIQHFMAADPRDEIPALEGQVAERQQTLNELEQRLAEASDANRDVLLARLRTHGVELDGILPFHQAGIGIEPFEIGLPASLAEYGLEVTSQQRGALVEDDDVANAQRLPINMTVTGSLTGLVDWISATHSYERLVTVDRLEFSIDDETGLIRAGFTVNLWFGDLDTIQILEVDADPAAAAVIYGEDVVREVELGTGTDTDDVREDEVFGSDPDDRVETDGPAPLGADGTTPSNAGDGPPPEVTGAPGTDGAPADGGDEAPADAAEGSEE